MVGGSRVVGYKSVSYLCKISDAQEQCCPVYIRKEGSGPRGNRVRLGGGPGRGESSGDGGEEVVKNDTHLTP